MRKVLLLPLALILSTVFLVGCRKKVGPTSVMVEDSIRHYYPVVQGQVLDLQYRLGNVGNTPLVITDIQPSCGCIAVDAKYNNIVPPGKEITLRFKYRSEMNVGYVHHTIRLFGNILPRGMTAFVFDVNVVPRSDYTRDYEEIYKEESDRRSLVEGLVDGEESQRGYYVDVEHDSRSHSRYPWRKE